jgi:hypothetical protein
VPGNRQPPHRCEKARRVPRDARRLPHRQWELFAEEDLASLLTRRPATLKTITIRASALRYDGTTLKPLAEVLEHTAVKAELERYRKDGGAILMPR